MGQYRFSLAIGILAIFVLWVRQPIFADYMIWCDAYRWAKTTHHHYYLYICIHSIL